MPRYPELSNNVPTHCFQGDYAGAETNTEIVTPSSGRKICVLGVYASTAVNNVDVTLAFTTSGDVIYKLYTANRGGATGTIICACGAVDETIKLTCGAGTFVSIGYKEMD